MRSPFVAPVLSSASPPTGFPGVSNFLTCEYCGTFTDQWWFADYAKNTCKCVVCEAQGTSQAVSPIGFITCPEPRTSFLSQSRWQKKAENDWEKEQQKKRVLSANQTFDVCPDCTLSCQSCSMSRQFLFGLPRHGYKVNLFPSGEMSGAMYSRNTQSRPPRMFGSAVSLKMTHSARQKIRRAVENSPYNLNVFMTLTFAPSVERKKLSCADLNDYATFRNPPVSHSYAKKELVRFLNTLSKRQRRTVDERERGEYLQYIWTAELQKNGNIHFHILLNTRFPIFWLTRTWKQANNSVDVKSLTNGDHAARYISKYISKDEASTIEGRRYYITEGLRESMKPSTIIYEGLQMKKEIQEILQAMKEDIESEGGTLLDFGFHIPKPKRSRPYKDKKGKKKFTKSTSSRIQAPLLELLDEHYNAHVAPF